MGGNSVLGVKEIVRHSPVTRTASILRACASSSTRLRGELGNQPFAGLIGGGEY